MRTMRRALVVVRGHVVVGDEHDLVRVPDLRAEPLEHRLHAARPARVVDHREVDRAGDDLARRDRLAPGGAGDELLRERPGLAAGLIGHRPR